MCVYPGGGVDPRDFDADVAWAGPEPADWAERLGCDEEMARALVCAAVRETFEESGVLLAGPHGDEVVADTTGDDWEADRVALESRELAMTDFLTRRGLVLRTDLLGVWAAWLTPVFEPKRYRTWFFVALLPEGQRTRDVSSESSEVTWLPAADALAMAERGEMLMMPPTYLTSLEVAQYAGPTEVVDAAHGRTVEMHTPGLEALGEGWTLSVPEHLRSAARRPHTGHDRGLGRRDLRRAGALPARAEPRDDDARRHQQLGAHRARLPPDRWSSTPARSRTATSTSSTSRPATSRWCC